MGVNIYETIIDEGYRRDIDEIVKLLSFKVDEKYELGGMTHLEILSDYLALNNIRFDIRNYPWVIIRDKFNYNYSTYVKDKRLFYNTFTNIGKQTIKTNPILDAKGNMAMYKHICELIWEHNKTSDEKWNPGLINPNSTAVELNDILNLVYTHKYSTYKYKFILGDNVITVITCYHLFRVSLIHHQV